MDDGSAEPSPQLVDQHPCPWPGCNRVTSNAYWGCSGHWSLLPGHLKFEYLRATKNNDEPARATANTEISQWIRAARSPKELAPLPAFASGVTDEGKVFLFWPREGQYIEITRDEATLALRSIRAMLTTEPRP